MAKLVLHTDSLWISPWVFTCFVALKEKALEFEAHPVALESQEQQAPAYRDASITARVPALEHGDFWVAESMAIVDYLEEAFADAPRALPADLRERARARQVLSWLRSDLAPLREERPTTTMFYAHADKPLSAAASEAAAKLIRVAGALVPSGRPTIAPSGFSVADADLAFVLHRLILNGHDVPAPLRAYAASHWARPSLQAFIDRVRPPLPAA
jgi:glutathione S-transferase